MTRFNTNNKQTLVYFLSKYAIDQKWVVRAKQIHSDNIAIIKDISKAKNLECDGLITNKKNICLTVKTADCLPITFWDDINKVVGIVHAGWRGTEKKIAKKAVIKMVKEFGCSSDNVKVYIGPAIDKNNYIVKKDLYDIFHKKYPQYLEKIDHNQWKLDLIGINMLQLKNAGIKNKNIATSGISTYVNKDYPSYRRTGQKNGFYSAIMLK